MGRKKRRVFSPEFKFEVVLEALRGEKSAAEVCRAHNLSENLLSRWKQEFLEQGAEVFRRGERATATADESSTRIAELERMVGKLTMQIEILVQSPPCGKKASSVWESDSRRNGR